MKKHIREIKVFDIVRYFILPNFYIAATWVFYFLLNKYPILPFNTLYVLPLFILITIHFVKMILIGAVLMYKAFAPLETRRKCRFKPTCSTYMIMSLKKYGLFVGLTKGILRILRCRPPYEGEDYP